MKQTLKRLMEAWKRTRQYEGVTRFLVARFLYTDAMNTVFLLVSVFAITELGFSDEETNVLATIGILAAQIKGS